MSSSPANENLKREIGPVSLALSSMNIMIGTGIFALPAIIAEGLGATAILAYFACGFLVFLLALCFAEVGSKTAKSGGPYTYIESAFGPFAGFLAGNLYLIGAMASDAALATALADTLQHFVPSLRVNFYRVIFQFIIFGGLAWLNISSVKNGIRFVVVTGIAKLIPLILLVAFALPAVKGSNLGWDIAPTVSNIGGASLILFFAFMGFEGSLSNGGEIKNPARTVPLGIIMGLCIVLLLYIGIQIVTQGVLGSTLSADNATPLAAVANILWGKTGMILTIIVSAIAILGSLSGEILSMPRIAFASARNGYMPAAMARVHPRFATPHVAIIVYVSCGFVMTVSGGFRQLVIIASSAILLTYLGVALASIRLRKIHGNKQVKGFHMPGGIMIPSLASITIIWLLSNSTKNELLTVGGCIVLLSIVYGCIVLAKRKAKTTPIAPAFESSEVLDER